MSRCFCGDTECPSCGTAQGTYNADHVEAAFRRANRNIKQLCDTVNTLAGFRKVRAKDFQVSVQS